MEEEKKKKSDKRDMPSMHKAHVDRLIQRALIILYVIINLQS
jgi:hypothetical protein